MTWAGDDTHPYAPNADNVLARTVGLEGVIAEAIRVQNLGLRVAIPCRVHAVHGNQLVDLEPLLQARYAGGQVKDLPLLAEVPVSMPVGLGYSIKYPVGVGDSGLCLFADRSLDTWAQSDGTRPIDPQDNRSHDLSDGIFVPGLVTIAKQTTDTTDDMVLNNGEMTLRVQADGTLSVSNGQHELLDLLCQLTQNLSNLCQVLTAQTYTLTALGPQPFLGVTQTAIAAQKTAIDVILASLKTLKGKP